MPDYQVKYETVGGTDYLIRSLLDFQQYSEKRMLKDIVKNNFPVRSEVVSLSNDERPFDKLRANGGAIREVVS